MVARGFNHGKDVFNLNAGFALPDPNLDKWRPDEDNIPKAGTKKDSRFDPQNLLSAARRREAGRALSSPERDSEASPKPNIKAYPKLPLDGKGKWGDWGVSATGASPYIQQQYEAKARSEEQNDVKNTLSAHDSVPHNIDGMNELLAARSAADRARTSETYRNGTAPRTAAAPQKRAVSEYLPPHLRKKQTVATSVVPMPLPKTTHNDRISPPNNTNSTLHISGEDLSPRREKDTVLSHLGSELSILAVTDQESRRPSSVTLVNQEDDETYAMQLQLKEYTVVAEAPAQFSPSPTKPTSAMKAPELYRRHNEVHEILWKQYAVNIPTLEYPANELYQMNHERFNSHLRTIQGLFEYRWNKRYETVQHIMKIQAEMDIKNGQSLDDLLRMREFELERSKEDASKAYDIWKNGSDDTWSLYAEDLCSVSSGTGNVDMADEDDEDEDLIVFSGRG